MTLRFRPSGVAGFPPATRHACLALVIGAVGLASAQRARADDFIVYSPHVIGTQTELELRGYGVRDGRSELGGQRAGEFSIAHAVTNWWKPELYLAEYEKEPGEGGGLVGYEFENTFQLTEPGRYWADFGLLASYGHPDGRGPGELEFGPLIEKAVGRFDHRVNLIWEREVGGGAAGKTEFRYSYAGTYAVTPAFRPGIEAYGRPDDDAYQAGPTVSGEWHVPGTAGNVEYRVGMLLGINAAAPRRTWLVQLEYEFF
jgi:hypothetical protein